MDDASSENQQDRIGRGFKELYVWSQSPANLFVDVDRRIINFEYLRPYFDQVSLPLDLAKACLADIIDQPSDTPDGVPFIKFVPLSVLRRHERLPSYWEISGELVDYRDIPTFRLQRRLSWWGGRDLSKSPCIFVSTPRITTSPADPQGFDFEYLPTMVNFLCTTWLLLQDKSTSNPEDIPTCFRIIIEALKFSGEFVQ